MPSSALSRSRFLGRLPGRGVHRARSQAVRALGISGRRAPTPRPRLRPRRARLHGAGMLSGPHWAPLFPAPLRTASLCILMGFSPHPLRAPAQASALRPGHPSAGRSAPRPNPRGAGPSTCARRAPHPHPHPGGPAARGASLAVLRPGGERRPAPPAARQRPAREAGAGRGGGGAGSGGSARPRRPLCGGGGGAWARPPSGARLRAALRPARPPGKMATPAAVNPPGE